MLMVRRKCGRWIHCVHEKSGDTISLQIHEVTQVGSAFQITVAIQDERRNYLVLKPGEHGQARLEGRPPPGPPPEK
jgi:hypothetical protein